MKLGQSGEDRLLRELLPALPRGQGVLTAAGDDCAVVAPPGRGELVLLKTDSVVEKIHFATGTPAEQVGWKAMMRPLSDFAAVSGLPQFALVTLIAPARTRVAWVRKLYRGLNRAAAKFDVSIVGGETSNTRGPIAISVSVAGRVEKERMVRRRGGRAGDDLFVTGRLGGSIRGRHLRFVPRIAESRWLTRYFPVRAMMDLSDGLGADLPRLARASGVGFEVFEKDLPRHLGVSVRHAISDGEDYELLFAISPRQREKLQNMWRRKFPLVRLTRIGRFIRRSKIGNRKLPGGYVHFR